MFERMRGRVEIELYASAMWLIECGPYYSDIVDSVLKGVLRGR